MSITPSNANLPLLASKAAVPHYDRGTLRAGILHIGVGNFHRAHQAVYLDDLFNGGRDHDWAIVGAGVREADPATGVRSSLPSAPFARYGAADVAGSPSCPVP